VNEYATDAKDRESIPRRLMFPTIIAALVVTWIVELLKQHIGLLRNYGWMIDVSSAPFFYDLFRNWFDNTLWRKRIGGKPLSEIPNLNGTWIGMGRSSYKGQDGRQVTPYRVVVYINQTWSRICIELNTKGSESKSTMAALNTENSARSGLRYEYINTPRSLTFEGLNPETMHMHEGVVQLRLGSDRKTLNGDYYTDQRRNNCGSLDLHFHSDNYINYTEMMDVL
jgi:hypothetical protein